MITPICTYYSLAPVDTENESPMTAPLDIDRLYRESVPIAIILAFWVLLSWIGSTQGLGAGLRLAGIVMALLYTGVRGVTLARTRPATPQPTSIAAVLRENGRVLVSAGGWIGGHCLV